MKRKNIAKHLSDYLLNGTMSDALKRWRGENEEHERFFNALDRDNFVRQTIIDYEQTGQATARAWNNVAGKIVGTVPHKRDRFVPLLIASAAFAAVVVCALIITTRQRYIPEHNPSMFAMSLQQPTLFSSGGEQIILTEGQINMGAVRAAYHNGELRYDESFEGWNTVLVPRGGVVNVVLADGSRIVVNALSKLSYALNERRVKLSGEAYMDIAHDEKRPFRVETACGVNLEVLGTTFNVEAYEKERNAVVTLVRGTVSVIGERFTYTMRPNERVSYDRRSDGVKITQVNTEDCNAWQRGEFSFDDIALEDLMQRLTVYYDFEPVYLDEAVRGVRFGFKLPHYDTIAPLLHFIELTSKVHTKVDGSRIYFGL